jgi:hypothetical protein
MNLHNPYRAPLGKPIRNRSTWRLVNLVVRLLGVISIAYLILILLIPSLIEHGAIIVAAAFRGTEQRNGDYGLAYEPAPYAVLALLVILLYEFIAYLRRVKTRELEG